MKNARKVLTYLFIIGIAVVTALSYELFIFPNNFAPAGLNGICTMIQYVFGISVGYLNLLFNIPLCLIAIFFVEREFITKSLTYTLAFSGFLLLFKNGYIDLSRFVYVTANGTSTILAPIAAGVLNGLLFTSVIKTGGSMGGMDIVAACIRKVKPHLNMNTVIFSLNTSVALISYFVYDFNVEPVILCILYSFASSTLSERVTKSGRTAVRCEIITDDPQKLCDEVIHKLHHSATVFQAKGAFTGKEKSVIVCIVNPSQVTELTRVVTQHPGSFVALSQVSNVIGNFKRLDSHGNRPVEVFDSGKNS